MAVGPAIPNKPTQDVLGPVFTPNHVNVERARVLEELRKEAPAKSVPELEVEAELEPTGEDIHAVAREKQSQAAPGRATVQAPAKPATGKEVVEEAAERKRAAQEATDEDAKARDEKLAAAADRLAAEDKARKDAADKEAAEGRRKADEAKAKAKAAADKK